MIILINGYPQDASNLIVPNGSISFVLNVDATVIAAPGGFVAADTEVVFQFNSAGQIQPNPPAAAAQIWSNAELNPQNANGLGTYYLVTFYDQNGARLNKSPMWWQFPEANGDTVDISKMTPYATVGGNVIFYPTAFTVPFPTPTTLGGVYSNAGESGYFITSINTDGTVSFAQAILTPSGNPTDVQINLAGSFYGDAGFTYTPSSGIVTRGPAISSLSAILQTYAGSGSFISATDSTTVPINALFLTQQTTLASSGIGLASVVDATNPVNLEGVAIDAQIYITTAVDFAQTGILSEVFPTGVLNIGEIQIVDGYLEYQSGVSGTITDIYGFKLEYAAANIGSVTVDNIYGFYCSEISANVSTFSAAFYAMDQGNGSGVWAFYSGGSTPSNFGGTISCGGVTSSGEMLSTGIFNYYGIDQSGTIIFNATSVANAVGSSTTYTGTFSNSSGLVFANGIVKISGFTNSQNNGYFYVTATNGGSSPTTITVNNSSGIAETHAATVETFFGLLSGAGFYGIGAGSGSITVGSNTYNTMLGAIPQHGTVGISLARNNDPFDATTIDTFLTDQNNHGFQIVAMTDGVGTNVGLLQLGILSGNPGLSFLLHDTQTGITASGTGTTINTSVGTITIAANVGSSSDVNTLSINGTTGIRINCQFVAPLTTPSSSSATGIQGQIEWDASYVYVCTATNTWKRVALSSF